MRTLTAVEWLVAQINADSTGSLFVRQELVEEALRREKEQTENAFKVGKAFEKPEEIK